MNGKIAVFLDRDGVINKKAPEDQYITSPKQIILFPKAAEAIALLNNSNYLVVIITNQRGIGKGLMTITDFWLIMHKIEKELSFAAAHLDAIYFCPDLENDSLCRKPNIGMIGHALKDFPNISLKDSWLIGDSSSDQECAAKAHLHFIGVTTSKSHSPLLNPSVPSLYSAVNQLILKQPFPK